MNQSKILINILILLLVCGLIIFGYFFFFGPEDEVGISTTSTSVANPNVSTETSEFLVLLRSLQSVKLSGEIFNNPVFATELVNYTTPIPSRPQGRSNPFAPLGTANVSGSETEAVEESITAETVENSSDDNISSDQILEAEMNSTDQAVEDDFAN